MKTIVCIAVFCVVAIGAKSVSADFLIQLGKDGEIGVTSISVTPGTTVNMDVYLTQIGFESPGVGEYRLSSGSLSRGLGGFYFDLGVSNAIDGSSQAGIRHSAISTFAYGPGFSDQTLENGYLDSVGGVVVQGPTSAARFVGFGALDQNDFSKVIPVYVAQEYQSTSLPNVGNLIDNSLLLGTLSFDISHSAVGAYQLELSAPGAISRSSLGHDPLAGHFDAQFIGATFHFTAVPEPSSFILVSCALLAGFSRYRKRLVKAREHRA